MIVPLLVAALTFAVAARVLGRRSVPDPARRIALLVGPRHSAAAAPSEERRGGALRRPAAVAAPWLVRAPGWQRFAQLLDRAGIRTAPTEVACAAMAALFLLALLALLFGTGVFGVVVIGLVAALGFFAWLTLRASRRRARFDEHLPDVLTDIASALRAGHGFLQAMQAVASDAPEPIGPELGRVLAEARLGRPIEDALLAAGARVGSDDFNFVLDAIIVQRQVGGSLAGIFEIVGESVRHRQQFALKVGALTAMGRMSAAVLVALPLVMAGALTLMNRTYMQPLVETGLGRSLLIGALGLLVVGCFWLRQIAAGVE